MRIKTAFFSMLMLLVGALGIPQLRAQDPVLDPPHDSSNFMDCHFCHLDGSMAAHWPLGGKSSPEGNANLCLSCHVPGGFSSAMALADSDQALPAPGLPTNLTATGTSHRWDSGIAGRVLFVGGAASNSSGTVQSSGTYTGRYSKTYTITMTAGGNSGTASFDWSATSPGGGSGTNVATGINIPLDDQGITLTFTDGASSPSFQVNDRWHIIVRRGLNQPTNEAITAVNADGMLMCSICHSSHVQTAAPFDTNAPAYPAGTTGGKGRHFQRIANDEGQLCHECHAARYVTNALAGSHPVGIGIVTNSNLKRPVNLPLDRLNHIECQTCHVTHLAPTADGDLARLTNRTALCTECHTLADTASPAAHMNPTNHMLWPGGQYGSKFPQKTDVEQQGTCINCHQTHGWPDGANPAQDYPGLLVEREENLCFTCHDGAPAAKNVKNDFDPVHTVRHPVRNDDALRLLQPGRKVECTDCHSTHKAMTGAYVYTNTATASRNLVINPNIGVTGVAFNYGTLTNFAVPTAGNYTAISNAVYEYQICFKCHTSYSWTNSPPNGISANGTVANAVETDLAQAFNPNNKSGHPIIKGLDNYPNSKKVGNPLKQGLQAAAMKAPWNTNVGQQTMTCIDCHNTDAASPAAQGPHGSAAAFMLRVFPSRPLNNKWPDVLLSAYDSQSWCYNCHNKTASSVHDKTHKDYRCYQCHIVVPHGGKMSRLMADHDSSAMPARFAFSNQKNTSNLRAFTKKSATNGYVQGDCNAGCDNTHNRTTQEENW